MTGLSVVGIALAVAIGFGLYRRVTDGRARAVAGGQEPRLDAVRLGRGLGSTATLVQFSSAVCAPCRTTRTLLASLTADEPALAHIELDAETRLDLVEEFGIARTPTVLVLDSHGVIRHRIVGAPRRPDVLNALNALSVPAAA